MPSLYPQHPTDHSPPPPMTSLNLSVLSLKIPEAYCKRKLAWYYTGREDAPRGRRGTSDERCAVRNDGDDRRFDSHPVGLSGVRAVECDELIIMTPDTATEQDRPDPAPAL